MNTFFVHVNNHANRKSYRKMTSKERKKALPSYTVVGILEDNTFRFGVSKCSNEDIFSKETGRKIALKNLQDTPIPIPQYILDNKAVGKYFVARAKRLIK